MITEKDIELIDKYLSGDLSEAGQKEIELRILQDKDFAETVEFIKNLKTAAKNVGRNELKSKIEAIFDEKRKERKKAIGTGNVGKYFSVNNPFVEFNIRKVYAIAASLIVLIISAIIIVLLVQIPKSSNNMAENKTDTINASNKHAENLLRASKKIQGKNLSPVIIKSSQFGYGGESIVKPEPILIKTINDKEFTNHYLLSTNTLILLGEFNLAKIIHLYQAPLFLVLEYSGTFYHLKRIEGEVRPLLMERDSLIIRHCSGNKTSGNTE